VRQVLVVAADQLELRHIRQREGWLLVANGPGPQLAAAAVDAVPGKLDVIVSTGVCGGLDPSLSVADIVVATEVNGMVARQPRTTRRYASGPVVSTDRVASTAEEKRRLRDSGAIAVEMEAAAVAERALARGAGFYCVRAVSDVAGETFLLDFNAARGSDGRFSVWKILGQAARSPGRGLPELLRLRRNATAATKALGDFFADCEF
jgi:hypothetical protein